MDLDQINVEFQSAVDADLGVEEVQVQQVQKALKRMSNSGRN